MWSHRWSYYSFVVTEVPEEPFRIIDRVKPGWDGNVKHISPTCSQAFKVAAAKAEDAELSSDTSDDEAAASMASISRQNARLSIETYFGGLLLLDQPTLSISM